jgi:uncharacterized OsmC-like protein
LETEDNVGDSKRDLSVDIELVGEETLEIHYHSPMLKDHVLDYPSVPEEARSGQMRRLLCASAVGCFTGTVRAALVSRGATIRSLKGTCTATTSEGSPPVVSSIDIRVEVAIDDEDEAILERVRTIAARGCLITRSLAQGMDVTHTIVRV